MAKTKAAETAEIVDEAVETTDGAAEAITEALIQESVDKEEIRQTIYIGPSIRGVMTGTVFIGIDLPEHLETAIKWQPAIKELIVPICQLPEARKQLQDGNSAMSKYFMKVKGE